MATSEVQIVNAALSLLGEQAISSLSENSTAAKLASRLYAITRDALLRAHPWNFAITRSTLGLLSATPEFGWSYQFALPNDCLRVLALNDDEEAGDPGDVFKVEQGRLLTNEGTAQIRYIAQIADVSKFDALFVDALASRLAADLADPLTASSTKQQLMSVRYSSTLAEAKTEDGQEGSPDIAVDNSLTNCR